jgi:hypothetical protein
MKRFAMILGVVGMATTVQAQLVIATGDFDSVDNNGIWHVDVGTGDATLLYSGYSVWGMASDASGRVWFTANDGGLYSFAMGDAAPTLETFVKTGGLTDDRLDGLAWVSGDLYGWQQFDDFDTGSLSGLYEVDPTTGGTTYLGGNAEGAISGIDADPTVGQIYGVNDTTVALNTISLGGTASFFADYPAGEFDIDGLAAGGGSLWLVVDEPGTIYEFDLATMTYVSTIPNPFGSADTFAAGAYIVPAPSALALLGLGGFAVTRRRR